MLIRLVEDDVAEGPFVRKEGVYGGPAVIENLVHQAQFWGLWSGFVNSNVDADHRRALLFHLVGSPPFVFLTSRLLVAKGMGKKDTMFRIQLPHPICTFATSYPCDKFKSQTWGFSCASDLDGVGT